MGTEKEEVEDIEVELPDETESDAPEAAAPETGDAPAAKSAADGIEDLRRQIEAEKLARKAAEDQARQASDEAGRYRTQAHQSQADALANVLDLATQEIERQKLAYRAAREAMDVAAEIEAQAALAEATAARAQAQRDKALFERQMKEAKERPPPQAPQRNQYTPETQDWIDRTPRFNTDLAFQRRVFKAHDLVVEEGIKPDTAAYFSRIDALLDLNRNEAEAPVKKDIPRRAPTVAAPVSRSDSSATSQNPKTFRLTQEMKEVADANNMTYQEYAKLYMKSQREAAKH